MSGGVVGGHHCYGSASIYHTIIKTGLSDHACIFRLLSIVVVLLNIAIYAILITTYVYQSQGMSYTIRTLKHSWRLLDPTKFSCPDN